MKKILLLIVFIVNSFFSICQTEYLVTINPATGGFTKINNLPNINWINSANAALDATGNNYIFQGSPDLSSYFLCSTNINTGSITNKVSFTNTNGVSNLIYIDEMNTFYGIQGKNNQYYLISVNNVNGAINTLKLLNNIGAVYGIAYNHNLNQIIISGVASGSFTLLVFDVNSGNILSQVSTSYLSELQFDNTTNQLFGFGVISNSREIGTIDVSTGQFSAIYNLPSTENIVAGMGTFDERDHEYVIVTENGITNWYLYFVNVSTKKLVYKDIVEAVNGTADNVLFYRYDNASNIMYALHWELHTMPINFLSFNLSMKQNNTLLNWKTANEVNTSIFIIQRSTDAINFTNIDFLNTLNKAGENDYFYTDSNLNGMRRVNVVYYRIKEVDRDGKINYSATRSINFKPISTTTVYPNPVKDKLSIAITTTKDEAAQIEVVDINGKVLFNQNINLSLGTSTQTINVSTLAKGNYFINIKTDEGNISEKFVKE